LFLSLQPKRAKTKPYRRSKDAGRPPLPLRAKATPLAMKVKGKSGEDYEFKNYMDQGQDGVAARH
jgi:hypothetical protein